MRSSTRPTLRASPDGDSSNATTARWPARAHLRRPSWRPDPGQGLGPGKRRAMQRQLECRRFDGSGYRRGLRHLHPGGSLAVAAAENFSFTPKILTHGLETGLRQRADQETRSTSVFRALPQLHAIIPISRVHDVPFRWLLHRKAEDADSPDGSTLKVCKAYAWFEGQQSWPGRCRTMAKANCDTRVQRSRVAMVGQQGTTRECRPNEEVSVVAAVARQAAGPLLRLVQARSTRRQRWGTR